MDANVAEPTVLAGLSQDYSIPEMWLGRPAKLRCSVE